LIPSFFPPKDLSFYHSLSHLRRIVDTRNQGDDFSGGGVVKYAHDAAGIDV